MQSEDPLEIETGSSRNEQDTPLDYQDKVFKSPRLCLIVHYCKLSNKWFMNHILALKIGGTVEGVVETT